MGTVAFGILGTGFMARTYAEALKSHVPSGRLVAVALGSRAPSLAADYGVAVEPSAEALLARDDIQAVIIATPHRTHLPLTQAAAAAGKHVYIEKPMAVTLADCDAIALARCTTDMLSSERSTTAKMVLYSVTCEPRRKPNIVANGGLA